MLSFSKVGMLTTKYSMRKMNFIQECQTFKLFELWKYSGGFGFSFRKKYRDPKSTDWSDLNRRARIGIVFLARRQWENEFELFERRTKCYCGLHQTIIDREVLVLIFFVYRIFIHHHHFHRINTVLETFYDGKFITSKNALFIHRRNAIINIIE